MLLALFYSVICGGIIGIERKLKNKSVGLKTLGLISLGSTLFTLISLSLPGDPTRIISNIITGIGFIGAGCIFRDGKDHVSGLTTASIVWITSALGVMCGIGLGLYACSLAIVVVLLMIYGQKVEKMLFAPSNSERLNRITEKDKKI